ncbi:MAG: 30S ribosomal protein S8 [Candidatus Sungbacteria bacterium]|nr:30S ribosomal protein S8 [Candidatus Sungbacteria bacterium]
MNDPISDMFIRIKNAQRAKQEMVRIPYSQMKHEIARALERSGMVGVSERKGKRIRKVLDLQLLYPEGKAAITEVKLISKPSRRLYSSYKDLHRPARGGVILLTTSKGILSSAEAHKEKVGGQLLAEIW